MNREEYYAQIAQRYIPSDPFWQKYHQHRFQTFNALVPDEPRRVLDFAAGPRRTWCCWPGSGPMWWASIRCPR